MPQNFIHYGAKKEEWDHLDLVLGLTEDLLPVVSNPNAVVSPQSKIKKVGKVPSKYNSSGNAVGIPDWTSKYTTSKEISEWSTFSDYGICLIARRIRALDIDVPDPKKSAVIAKFITEKFGVLPARVRSNSGKLLLAFEMEGEFPKRDMKVDGGIIEFLANRQQFIFCGTHESGVRYNWADYNSMPDSFPVKTFEEFENLWQELEKNFALEPSSSGSLRKAPSETIQIEDDISIFISNKKAEILRGYGKENQLFIECPWKDEHTSDSGDTETAYFPAGGRGYTQGHFRCMHAHCANRTDQDFLLALGYHADDFEIVKDPLPKVIQGEELIGVGDYGARPPIDWLIKNLLPRHGTAVTYGSSGDGKTFAVLDMCFAIVRGLASWNGHKVKKGRVVYICAEGAGGFVTRLKAYAKHYSVILRDFNDDFFVIPSTPSFRKEEDVKRISDKINAKGQFDMVVIDTFAQVTAGADENTGKDMGPVLSHIQLLGQLTGALIHPIAHAGKDQTRGLRGWSGIKAILDAEFEVSREEEIRRFWVSKLKDERDGFGWEFALQTETLDVDTDGDMITSCYVDFTGKAGAKKEKEVRKLGKWQQAASDAWEALGSGDADFEKVLNTGVDLVPKPDGKDNRRERIRIALVEIIARAGYKHVNGKITVDLAD